MKELFLGGQSAGRDGGVSGCRCGLMVVVVGCGGQMVGVVVAA